MSTNEPHGWRPPEARTVHLPDGELARIGLATVFEARAKCLAALVLKPLTGLTPAQWVKAERMQFVQIMERAIKAAQGVDTTLEGLLADLERARSVFHDARHLVVHAVWGEHPGTGMPTAFDQSRQREITTQDIVDAMNGCATMYRIANNAVRRTAELIKEGKLPSGDANVGPGMSMQLDGVEIRF